MEGQRQKELAYVCIKWHYMIIQMPFIAKTEGYFPKEKSFKCRRISSLEKKLDPFKSQSNWEKPLNQNEKVLKFSIYLATGKKNLCWHFSDNLCCSDSPNRLLHLCQILQKCATFGNPDTHPSILLKSLSNIFGKRW